MLFIVVIVMSIRILITAIKSIFTVLAHCQSYYAMLSVAVIIGFGKGLRTVFVALVLPTYVPLHKLPGATGIQLLSAGIAFLALGPVVGKYMLEI